MRMRNERLGRRVKERVGIDQLVTALQWRGGVWGGISTRSEEEQPTGNEGPRLQSDQALNVSLVGHSTHESTWCNGWAHQNGRFRCSQT